MSNNSAKDSIRQSKFVNKLDLAGQREYLQWLLDGGTVEQFMLDKAPKRSISLRLARAINFRYNENHDELGKFAESDGGGSGSGSGSGSGKGSDSGSGSGAGDSKGETGSDVEGNGGNNLNHREVYLLQAGTPDSQVRKVYDAEEKFQPTVKSQTELPPPKAPSSEMLKKGEMTRAEYDTAYKQYSKQHGAWVKESTKNIQSDAGARHLNGTTKGSQNYVDEVTKSDWFVKEFGDGGVIGTPKVTLKPSNKFAGRYFLTTKDGGTSGLDINKGYSMNEPTLIHELSHYATTISSKTPFAGHGVGFAKNHIFVAKNIAGPDYAAGLEKAYKEEGVKIG